jgi:hypothetical protein
VTAPLDVNDIPEDTVLGARNLLNAYVAKKCGSLDSEIRMRRPTTFAAQGKAPPRRIDDRIRDVQCQRVLGAIAKRLLLPAATAFCVLNVQSADDAVENVAPAAI